VDCSLTFGGTEECMSLWFGSYGFMHGVMSQHVLISLLACTNISKVCAGLHAVKVNIKPLLERSRFSNGAVKTSYGTVMAQEDFTH